MGKTSSKAKNRYNLKTYDYIRLTVKKGQRDEIKKFASSQGKSLNSFVVGLISKEMEQFQLSTPGQAVRSDIFENITPPGRRS